MLCRHCYADCASAPKAGELPTERWAALLTDLADRGVIQVYIEGGEPLLKPGFTDLLRAITPRMMTLVRTHGCGVSAHSARELADAGLGRVLVDVMGADSLTHDAHTGTPGSFAATCGAIRHFVNAGIPADALVILTRQTAPQLSRIAALAAGLGAQRLGILRLYPLGRARLAWAGMGAVPGGADSGAAGAGGPADHAVLASERP